MAVLQVSTVILLFVPAVAYGTTSPPTWDTAKDELSGFTLSALVSAFLHPLGVWPPLLPAGSHL